MAAFVKRQNSREHIYQRVTFFRLALISPVDGWPMYGLECTQRIAGKIATGQALAGSVSFWSLS
jgi:hypothetical protein